MADEKRVFGIDDLEELSKICREGRFSELENCEISPDTRNAPKAWSSDLIAEWTMLMRQFGDGPAICFAVPMLTPLIRRRIDFDKNFELYCRLWSEYESFLLKKLKARWLVSTLDTFIKNPRNDVEEAWAFSGMLFMKTIKLYETEMLRLEDFPDLLGPPIRGQINRMKDTYGRVMLFEQIQPFNMNGYGDMIKKMELRLKRCNSSELCYKITSELWDRAHQRETVYCRIEKALKRLEEQQAEHTGK